MLILVYGLALIYSATFGIEDPWTLTSHVGRQATVGAMGIVLVALAVTFDYRMMVPFAYVIYAATLLLLVAVIVSGVVVHGSQRWFVVAGLQFQPSEFAKLGLVICLARYVSDNQQQIGRIVVVVKSMVIVAIPVVLTLVQPDMGSSLVYIAIWITIMFVGGVRARHLAILGACALVSLPIAWQFMLEYMRRRILIFLDPTSAPYEEGYNVIQALISVGSGGLLGRGFTSGTQSQLRFLKVQYSDFIFSVLTEELGFVGAVGLLLLLGIFLFRVFRVALVSKDSFGRLVASGLAAMIGFQAMVNIGMNVGLLPVAGITLPLVSFGGSSLITVLFSVGLLESILIRHKRFEL